MNVFMNVSCEHFCYTHYAYVACVKIIMYLVIIYYNYYYYFSSNYSIMRLAQRTQSIHIYSANVFICRFLLAVHTSRSLWTLLLLSESTQDN